MGAEDWDDPHDIIPEEFRREFGDSETVADALQRAAARESTTPDSDQPCCPECYSTCVTPKSDSSTSSKQRKPGAWKCTECYEHFDERLDMNPNATAFDWIDTDELADPDERGDSALFATLDERTRTALAIVLYRPWTDAGPSLRELGELFPNSRYWVGERNREWRDGEHRDLVPDPTAAEPEPITDASSDATALATDGGRRSRWDAFGT